MSRTAYRIGTDTPSYVAEDLTGAGARTTGGRWSEKGLSVTYAAENRALACLETLVHLAAGSLPLNCYLVELTIPNAIWAAALRQTRPRCPPAGTPNPPAATASPSAPPGSAPKPRPS